MRLITLWEKEECLYRSSCSEYKDKGKRTNALERIWASLEYDEEEESTGPSVSDISTKLNSLKVYYSATRSKHESLIKSGIGAADIPPIKWPYFRFLTFLNDSITPRKPMANIHLNSESFLTNKE